MEMAAASSSPKLGPPVIRRRKKRMLSASMIPGSTLSGLNHSSIRVVELIRGENGYGFTISGQKPCLLRCVVAASPAEKANLRSGNCLVGVNGKDVSHLAHDEVVSLIGKCTGLLRLHIADSYFSESSDEESVDQLQPTRPKYHHSYHNRFRNGSNSGSKSSLSRASNPGNTSSNDEMMSSVSTERIMAATEKILLTPRTSSPPMYSSAMRRPSWDPIMSSPRRLPRSHVSVDDLGSDESPVPPVPARHRLAGSASTGSTTTTTPATNPNVESVSVFSNPVPRTTPLTEVNAISASKLRPTVGEKSSSARAMYMRSGSTTSGSSINSKKVGSSDPSPGGHSNASSNLSMNLNSTGRSSSSSFNSSNTILHQVVVGYVGSIDLPLIEARKRLETLTACVRRLRSERRMRSIVLLRIQSNGVSLFSSHQNAQTGPPLAFYSSTIISFCGAYNEDRRFFGLVTSTNLSKSCACHVFMVEPKLLRHADHLKRAKAFGIRCTQLPIPKSGQVLGLQECAEFPATADPVLNSIVRLHEGGSNNSSAPINSSSHRSPSDASTRLEGSISSNSDSALGFRADESDKNGGRVYDIMESQEAAEAKYLHRSPVPRKRHPYSHKKSYGAVVSQLQHHHQQQFQKFEDPVSHSHSSHTRHPPSISPGLYARNDAASKLPPVPTKPSSLLSELSGTPEAWRPQPNRADSSSGSNNRISLHHGNHNNSNTKMVKHDPRSTPTHIEVSVLVTPGAEGEASTSKAGKSNDGPPSLKVCYTNGLKMQLSRNGTRSLEDLTSDNLPHQPQLQAIETSGIMGSTPTLNKDCGKRPRDDFWDFKVPHPPKPKQVMNCVETWAESIEKLLGDNAGREVFTDFLQHEFSAENIYFYNACLRYKEVYPNLTECQRISMASAIFQRYVQNGAPDPINVDFQARSQVEKLLPQPNMEMFDLPLGQVFNLLKFDCYPRFLRSDTYRDYASGAIPIPQYEDTSDSDQNSVKSHKLESDGRRRSLLPWNLKNRSKNKNKLKGELGLNSDISFIQRAVVPQNGDSSDTDDSRRQSVKLCRVTLPDNSTTVLPCKPGESLSAVVQRILEKREFHYSAFEVFNVSNGKAMDLTQEASEMTAKEIRVEPRAFIGIELPKGWRVGIRANPFRKLSEVLKPILSQHSYRLDAVVVYDVDTDERLDMKCPMSQVDGHNVLVKLKDGDVLASDDDDLISTKTGSSQSSSVFRGFLRRSSKKYKKAPKQTTQGIDTVGRVDPMMGKTKVDLPFDGSDYTREPLQDENSNPALPSPSHRPNFVMRYESSPLSLVSTDLRLAESSRNRKPIYIAPLNNNDSEAS